MRSCARLVLVLVLVGVELGSGHDLARHGGLGRRVAEDRDLDLATLDRFLGEDPLVEVERQIDRGAEGHARPAPCSHRPTNPCWPASRSTAARARPRPGPRTRRGPLRRGARGSRPGASRTRRTLASSSPCPCRPQTRALRIPRTAGRRGRAAPGPSRPRRTGPWSRREHHVDVETPAPRPGHHSPELVELRSLDLERGRQRGRVVRDQLTRRVCSEPAAIAGDRDRHHLIALRVQRARHGDRGRAGDVVLRGAAPEHDHHRVRRSPALTTPPAAPRGCRGP